MSRFSTAGALVLSLWFGISWETVIAESGKKALREWAYENVAS
jgi:hypothetical protein